MYSLKNNYQDQVNARYNQLKVISLKTVPIVMHKFANCLNATVIKGIVLFDVICCTNLT